MSEPQMNRWALLPRRATNGADTLATGKPAEYAAFIKRHPSGGKRGQQHDFESEEEAAQTSSTTSGNSIGAATGGCSLRCVAASLACSMLAGLLVLAVCAKFRGLPGPASLQPRWEVTKLTIENIDLPGLGVEGIIPADTSKCPVTDPCGVAQAKGCSTCPNSEWNDGCLCRKNVEGRTGPAGALMAADSSACPSSDPCGMASSPGCAKCPDSSWISEGCSCRQPPISGDEFLKRVGHFLGSMLSMAPLLSPSVVKIGILAEAEVLNPARARAFAESGTFNITFREFVIGSATTLPVEIAPAGMSVITANVEVDSVPQTLGMMMLQEVLNSQNQLPVQVSGSVLVRSGPFSVHCLVLCNLVTDVSALPQAKFTHKECKYSYKV